MGSLGTFTKGAPLSKADISETGFPFILYGELYTTYKEVTYHVYRQTDANAPKECFSNIGDVIIPTSGETPEEIATATCVMVPNVILGGDLNIYRNNAVDGRIISYIINHKINKCIAKIAQGKSVVHIKADDLSKMNIIYPEKDEQAKIINFLWLIDKRIEKQRQLVESLKKYKRGLISKIFEQSCKNGEIVKLEAIGNFYSGLSGKNKDDFGIGDDIFITYMNVYKNVVADSNMCDKVKIKTNESQNEVQYGDILFTQSSETLEEVGFSSVWLSKQTAYLNSFCFGFRLLDLDKVDPVFISYYMRTNNIRKLIMREGQGATRVNLSSERLKQIKIELPKINIQKQIANIMLKTDERINMSKEIVFALTNMKQGLLQQMFI